MRRLGPPLALASLVMGACYDDTPYQNYIASISAGQASTMDTEQGSTSYASIASVTVTMTANATRGGSSSTGGASTSGGGEGDEGAGEAGEVGGDVELKVSLAVAPTHLERAGLVTLAVDHDSEVSWLELWDAAEPDEARLAWSPGEPTPDYLLTRGDGVHELRVRAYDDEGNVGVSEVATVTLSLPSPGTTLWNKALKLGQAAQGRAVDSGWSKGELTFITGLNSDSAAIVGRHNAEGDPHLYTQPASFVSTTTGVVLMPDGSVLAAGVDQIGITPRSWIAEVNVQTGQVQVIHTGALGEAATGLAVDLERDRMYISGYSPRVGSYAPDACLWARTLDGELLWSRTWQRPVVKPDKEAGTPSDRGWAVAVLDNGDPVMVGSSVFLTAPDEDPEHWAFVHRYDPEGTLGEARSWVSDEVFNAAGAYAVARDDDDGLLVAGWTSQDPKESRQATILAFDKLLMPAEVHTYGPEGSWIAKAVVRLTTGEIVYVADVDIAEQGRSNVEVRAINSFFGSALWTEVIPGEIGARSGGLTVTPEGHIVILGTSIHDGGSRMILQGIHP